MAVRVGVEGHALKRNIPTNRSFRGFHVSECECGWTSALHWSQHQAKESHKEHAKENDKR
jgi:hypothetical protein